MIEKYCNLQIVLTSLLCLNLQNDQVLKPIKYKGNFITALREIEAEIEGVGGAGHIDTRKRRLFLPFYHFFLLLFFFFFFFINIFLIGFHFLNASAKCEHRRIISNSSSTHRLVMETEINYKRVSFKLQLTISIINQLTYQSIMNSLIKTYNKNKLQS